MAEQLKTYDGAEVSIIVGGRSIKGLAETDAVTVARETEAFTTRAGLKGGVTRSKSSDRRGTITIKLEQTSLDNDYFSSLLLLDEKSAGGFVEILVRDAKGTTQHSAVEAWLQKFPDDAKGKEAGEIDWVFNCAELLMFIGGN